MTPGPSANITAKFPLAAAIQAVAAIASINLALTHQNLWPTPGIVPTFRLSVEAAIVVGVLALAQGWPRTRPWVRRLAATAVLVLIVARYAQVTLAGLFGRPIDIAAEARHFPAVADLVLAAVDPWLVFELALTALVAAGIVAAAAAWSVRAIERAMDVRVTRRTLGGAAFAVMVVYAIGASGPGSLTLFAEPVMPGIARQVDFALERFRRGLPGAFAPALADSNLSGLRGADVFAVFVESYGAAAHDGGGIAPALAQLGAAVSDAGWSSASAFVSSPTFGGASWLAHATIMTGAEVRGPRAYEAFAAGGGDTLADRFRAAGYHTVALVPGIRGPWPEGDALHVDHIVPAAGLTYTGPPIGWFEIPDQASFAWLGANELSAPGRDPVFVLFPTIMSHAPFVPVPEYLADWSRALDTDAFGLSLLPPLDPIDWTAWVANYAAAISYELEVLAGFVGERAGTDTLLIVLGDHQPPSIVSGTGARWDVPVHVIVSRPGLLEPFIDGGFTRGLVPQGAALGGMGGVTKLLLEGFDGR
jgi:hypothetical protein